MKQVAGIFSSGHTSLATEIQYASGRRGSEKENSLAGRDGVDADEVGRPFRGEGFGQLGYGCFGGARSGSASLFGGWDSG